MTGPGRLQARLREAVAELLDERTRLLVLFCELAGADHKGGTHSRRLLQSFCQLLVDYAALWQFEIHDPLVRSREHRQARAELARLQPRIQLVSEAALEFSDGCDASDSGPDPDRLDTRLSRLGELLAVRFDAEDRILSQI